jgi:SAM-dependent methyltransferase
VSVSVLIENSCHLCGGTDWKTAFHVTDTNQDVPGEWRILVCTKCHLGVLNPMPGNEEIASYYLDNFYTTDRKRFNPFIEGARSFAAGLRSTMLKKLMPKAGILLDFGAGPGHFGATMTKAGWTVVSVDLATSVNEKADDIHFTMIGDRVSLNFPDSYFDAVTLWYVIEHLRNPRIVLEELRRVLKPDGILLLAQQNFESYQSRFFKNCWLILDPPRHLYQFSPGNLSNLVEQEGFHFVAVKHSSLEMGPFTILQSSLNLLLGNKNYLFRFLKNRNLGVMQNAGYHAKAMIILSLGLSILLGPLSLLLYYILLTLRSGDVFTLYARK